MREVLQAYFKQKTTVIGIVTALMFQLIFSVVWMTGYDGITDNTDRLKIAIVNEDPTIGAEMVAGLKENLPFKLVELNDLGEAKERLNDREVQMVMHVPADFPQQVAAPGAQATIDFTINESNAQLIKSVMGGVANNITYTVNQQAAKQAVAGALSGMDVPADQAGAMAQGLTARVVSETVSMNQVDGMANQMIPMMMVLASYVGSMLLAMNLETSSMFLSRYSKWQRFAARTIILAGSSVIVALVGSALVLMLGGQSEQGFFAMWGFQALFVMTFMFVAQFFLLLLGPGGMLLNIIMLSLQLVSSGAMVPRELLSDFYRGLSQALPATYAVDGNMNLLFGGPSSVSDVAALAVIALSALVLGAGAVALKRVRQPQGQPQPTAA